MDKIHQQAIELKYQGKTHEQISQLLEGKLTKGTLDVYFASSGLLYFPYREYQVEQNKLRMIEGMILLKKEAENLVKIMLNSAYFVVSRAEKETNEDRKIKLYEKAAKLADRILERSGFNSGQNINPVTETRNLRTLSDEEFFALLKQNGIDPATGLPLTKSA